MIRLDFKTEQDFLNKEWIEKMIEANVPMKDNKYWLVVIDGTTYVGVEDDKVMAEEKGYPVYPTYSFAELFYKLIEWHPKYKGLILKGPIMWKDAPFYFSQYEDAPDESPFVCYSEYPIYSAAQLLINCAKDKFGCVTDVSNK